MARALALAQRGEGFVEPNPMVGCVIAAADHVISEGWHQKFGGPHAEIIALDEAGDAARQATLYTTLEPCCHQGKTPPCTQAIIAAGVARVVAAHRDPFPQVDGGGIAALESAGIACQVGTLETAAAQLLAPYLKLTKQGLPWVIAKWAMTLDGKIATNSGDSRWISNEQSRQVVQALRGRVDAIMVGSGTALADDPLLVARPDDPGQVRRVATRVVVDSACRLPAESKLATTTHQAPLLVAVSDDAPKARCEALRGNRAEVLCCEGDSHAARVAWLLAELGRRRTTNVLVEGGGRLLGTLLEVQAIDEVHVFIGPKLFGGSKAPPPIAGPGVEQVAQAWQLREHSIQQLAGDFYIRGRIEKP